MTGSTAFEEFVIRLDAAAASPENVGHTLPLAKLLQAIGGRLKPWHAVTELLLSGALIFTIRSGNQRLFSRINIEASGPMQLADLTASVVAGSTPAHISARDLGEILNLSPSASTKVARLIAIDRSSKKNVIRLEDAIGLANRFISLVEVSARLGCSPRAARLLLDRAGIRREHAAGYSRAEAESLIRVQSHRPSMISRNALPA
jgi:hypothetical protein